jgi:hypothetical protein
VVLGVAGAVVDFDEGGLNVGEEVDGASGGACGVGWDGGRELRLSQGEVEGAGEDELRLLAAGLAGDAGGGEVLAAGQRAGIDEGEAGGVAGALEKVVLVGAGRGRWADGAGAAAAAGCGEVDRDGGESAPAGVANRSAKVKRRRSCADLR